MQDEPVGAADILFACALGIALGLMIAFSL